MFGILGKGKQISQEQTTNLTDRALAYILPDILLQLEIC